MRDYTLATFLDDVLRGREDASDQRYKKAFGHFRKFAYDTVPSTYSLEATFPRGRGEMSDSFRKWHMDSVSTTLRKEFRMLSKEEQFGAWTTNVLAGESDLTTRFSDMSNTLQIVVPSWLELLYLTGTGRPSGGRDDIIKKISSDMVLPTCMVLRMSRPRICDSFTTCLGIYAYDAGLTASGINLFSCLGICCSHRAVLSRLRKAEQAATDNACKLGQIPTAVVAYDNFDFAEGRRGERIGDEIGFRSITNALVAADRLQIETAFSKRAWQPHKNMLSTVDFSKRLGTNAKIDEKVGNWYKFYQVID